MSGDNDSKQEYETGGHEPSRRVVGHIVEIWRGFRWRMCRYMYNESRQWEGADVWRQQRRTRIRNERA
jgi:hypothetical protein